MKRCLVCGRDPRPNTCHDPEEVTAAINRLKAVHRPAALIVEYLSFFVNMDTEPADNNDESEEEVLWDQDEDDSEASDIALVAFEDAKAVEECLANNSFIHGLIDDDDAHLAHISLEQHTRPGTTFNGITVDTAENRK